MPIPGGTAGAHDDSMHQGSAKRDVVDGVAGLDGSGNLLGLGLALYLVRSGLNRMYINDRTSVESAVIIERNVANDYFLYVIESSLMKRVQTESMKDVVSGIAALGAGGQLLVPGSDIELTRDGSENIEVVERTSGDIVYRWTRIGANDYECRINCGGVACKMLNDSLIDAVSGIAGLDANALLTPALLPPCLEEYSNHLGAVDNFTETVTGGNGTATPDATNHEMDLSTGVTVNGHSVFRIKDSYTMAAKPMIFNAIVQGLQLNTGGSVQVFIGFKDDHTNAASGDWICFHSDQFGGWSTYVDNGVSSEFNAITALANGDHVTIVATSSLVLFFVNGALVATHTLYIPTGAMYVGSSLVAYATTITVPRLMSVDFMSFKRYR